MSIVQDLLADIAAFIVERGITETTFGRMAVNDGKLLGRLRAGNTVTLATVDRVRAFIAAERAKAATPPEPPPAAPAAALSAEPSPAAEAGAVPPVPFGVKAA